MLDRVIHITVFILIIACSAIAQDSIQPVFKTPASIITPCPSLVTFANKHDLPLNHIKIRVGDLQHSKGDSVTFLITLYHGASMQQWLAIITQDGLKPDETQMEPLPDDTVYTSTGRVFTFKNTRTALYFTLLGPFTATKSKSEKRYIKQLSNPHRVLISQEKLNCDLAIYAERSLVLAKRCEAAGVKMRDLFYKASSKPISESELEKGTPFVKIIHPTDEEERIGFNIYFSLRSFYDAAMAIDEFKKILNNVLDKPSKMSFILNPGLRANINYYFTDVHLFNADGFGVEFPAYEQPLQLSFIGKIALRASVIMTKPYAPLKTCAGIVELYAEHPVDQEKRLLIQLISAYTKT